MQQAALGSRQRVVLFGGQSLADTWEYGGVLPASQPFGTACSGTNSPPILTSQTPCLGHPAFAFELIGARPEAPCVFGVSAARQDQLLPPCTLYLGSPILPLFALTNWAGFARSPTFAIPRDSRLRGLRLYAQAVVADPQGPVAGLTFSAALKLVVGD